jgi:hypothetical protein
VPEECKSSGEIEKWLTGKFFVVLENERHFIKDEFFENSIVSESSVKWYPVSSTDRDDEVRMVHRG